MIEHAEAYGLDFLVPTQDTAVGRCLRDYGEFARPEVALISQIVRNGTFVDVGANIGAISLPVAQKGNRVIAIEAHREIAAILSANSINNKLYNISVHHAAAGPESRVVQFPTLPISNQFNQGSSGFTTPNAPSEAIMMLTLDDICPEDTTVVKIDVEGFESNVLVGAENLLKNVRPHWIVETSHPNKNSISVISKFRSHNYRMYWFFAPFVTPNASRKGPADRIRGDVNVFAVPSEMQQPKEMIELTFPSMLWPSKFSEFPYLKRFGFEIVGSI